MHHQKQNQCSSGNSTISISERMKRLLHKAHALDHSSRVYYSHTDVERKRLSQLYDTHSTIPWFNSLWSHCKEPIHKWYIQIGTNNGVPHSLIIPCNMNTGCFSHYLLYQKWWKGISGHGLCWAWLLYVATYTVSLMILWGSVNHHFLLLLSCTIVTLLKARCQSVDSRF